MDIEEVAAHSPEKILRVPVSPETGLQPFQARDLAYRLGFATDQVDAAAKVMLALSKVYFDKDASIAEVNPLVVTKAGQVVVLDAKLDFDDNALFRHKDVQTLRDLAEENPVEVRASKANLNYIQLDGTIACLVNGAGLAMATMDIINYHGKDSGVGPANFLDVGGGVTPEAATEAFRIILADPKVKGVLVNIFGGIAKCDLIADALVKAGREGRLPGAGGGAPGGDQRRQGARDPHRRAVRVADDPPGRGADRGGEDGRRAGEVGSRLGPGVETPGTWAISLKLQSPRFPHAPTPAPPVGPARPRAGRVRAGVARQGEAGRAGGPAGGADAGGPGPKAGRGGTRAAGPAGTRRAQTAQRTPPSPHLLTPAFKKALTGKRRGARPTGGRGCTPAKSPRNSRPASRPAPPRGTPP